MIQARANFLTDVRMPLGDTGAGLTAGVVPLELLLQSSLWQWGFHTVPNCWQLTVVGLESVDFQKSVLRLITAA